MVQLEKRRPQEKQVIEDISDGPLVWAPTFFRGICAWLVLEWVDKDSQVGAHTGGTMAGIFFGHELASILRGGVRRIGPHLVYYNGYVQSQ